VGLPGRRQQYAIRVAVLAQRCHRQFAVLLAALGVFNSGKDWPDIFVALVMACFALQGAWLVIRLALAELQLRHGPHVPG
jgi:hypothetical protein